MKSPAHVCSLWILLMFCMQPVSHGKDAPKWEIKTRTLAHAPDGSPDSRQTFGIGEWVELKVIPETISNVEWIVEGDSRVTNRFANPTILIVGCDGGQFSIGATVHDIPQSRQAPQPDLDDKHKWLELEAKLEKLAKEADKPGAFEDRCEKLIPTSTLYQGLVGMEGEEVDRIVRLLREMNALSRKVPISCCWARTQAKILETACLRLGRLLDTTADKSKLGDDLWLLLQVCVLTWECQNKQFDDAGGEANAESLSGNAREFLGDLEYGRKLGATVFSTNLPHLHYLLCVQVLHALPAMGLEQRKKALFKHGLSEDQADFLIRDMDCYFEQ